MIEIALFLAASAADCTRVVGAIGQDRCQLAASMKLEPAPNCADRQSQFDMNVCSFRDYLRADIDLNVSWAGAVKRLKGMSASNKLIAGQRAWLTYRDRQCEIWADIYKGGSIESLVTNDCSTNITQSRVKELNAMLKDLNH